MNRKEEKGKKGIKKGVGIERENPSNAGIERMKKDVEMKRKNER